MVVNSRQLGSIRVVMTGPDYISGFGEVLRRLRDNQPAMAQPETMIDYIQDLFYGYGLSRY